MSWGGLWLIIVAISAAIAAWRVFLGGDRSGITEKVASEGGKVIWIKQLDSQGGMKFAAYADAVTFYDVLVERDGVRRIEVWRCGIDGAFKDH